jgi:hypothetical protein
MTTMPKAAPGSSGSESTDVVIEKVRVPFIHRAALVRDGVSEPLFLVDLGLEGAFAEHGDPLPVGATVRLSFRLPGNEIPLDVGCRVAWTNLKAGRLVTKSLPPGMGLWFVEMDPAERDRLRAYLSEYLRGGLRRFLRPWPPDLEDEP